MKEIKIEFVKSINPTVFPPVCPDTNKTVSQLLSELKREYEARGASIFIEERESLHNIPYHLLTINGRQLNEIVPLPNPDKYCGGDCGSCGSSSSGKSSGCTRAYMAIPESVVRLAMKKVFETE